MLTEQRFKSTLDLINGTLATLKRPGAITPERMRDEIDLLKQTLTTVLKVLEDRDVERALPIDRKTVIKNVGSALSNLLGFDPSNERDLAVYTRYRSRLITAIAQTTDKVRMPSGPSAITLYAAKAVCIIALGIAGMSSAGCEKTAPTPPAIETSAFPEFSVNEAGYHRNSDMTAYGMLRDATFDGKILHIKLQGHEINTVEYSMDWQGKWALRPTTEEGRTLVCEGRVLNPEAKKQVETLFKNYGGKQISVIGHMEDKTFTIFRIKTNEGIIELLTPEEP